MKFLKKKRCRRQGATAVEFAVVAPMVLIFIFGMLEVFNLYRVEGALTAATLIGGREASIDTANSDDVEAEITTFLQSAGVSSPRITIEPAVLNRTIEEVLVTIELDATAENGFFLRNFFTGQMRREITVQRF